MDTAIATLLNDAITKRTFPGAAVGVICGDQATFVTAGRTAYEDDSAVVTPETIYDVASLTKSVPLGILALQLIEQGRLELDKSLPDYLPEYAAPGGGDIKIRYLLTYTVIGFPFSKYASESTQALRRRILTEPLGGIPGQEYLYTNFPAYLLGLVIQRVANQPLDSLAKHSLFDPLGMRRTTFQASEAVGSVDEVAPTEVVDDTVLRGVVHDESARTLSADGEVVGHAGLFSCVSDMLRPVQALVHGGLLGQARILEASTIELLSQDQVPQVADRVTYGFELERPWMATTVPSGTFGKTGFTGCSLVVSPQHRVGWVLLSNHIHPKRSVTREAINAIRREIGDVILAHALP